MVLCVSMVTAEALEIVKDRPELVVSEGSTILQVLARKPRSFKKEDNYILKHSAEMGNTAFIVELIRQYPERVLELNDNKQTIFHVAISYRHSGVYSLLHQIGSIKASIISLEDEEGNNMLHLVGIPKKKETSSQVADIEGPILQMRHELQWSKVILPPSLREKKNKAGVTPHELCRQNRL
ncbi:hypothetical protein L2E82_22861 [Cichorium intybus]|uniref:Uncharacterized protein n=1 Tax=Cichorium intybus TaxID=13427 RepID=A0ACB9DYY4_CICIN|nr:hypothetical protein L2E82_22861 [Cichorium intybus]